MHIHQHTSTYMNIHQHADHHVCTPRTRPLSFFLSSAAAALYSATNCRCLRRCRSTQSLTNNPSLPPSLPWQLSSGGRYIHDDGLGPKDWFLSLGLQVFFFFLQMLDCQKQWVVAPCHPFFSLSPKASCMMIQHSVGPSPPTPLLVSWFCSTATFEGGHTATTNKKRARNRKGHELMGLEQLGVAVCMFVFWFGCIAFASFCIPFAMVSTAACIRWASFFCLLLLPASLFAHTLSLRTLQWLVGWWWWWWWEQVLDAPPQLSKTRGTRTRVLLAILLQ